MKKQSIYTTINFLIFLSFFVTTNGFSQPNAPENVQVVPRYEATISLIISWQDMSGDETGFEIERREEGGAFANLVDVGVGVTTYQDNTATADKMWEYRVRALGAGDNNSAWVVSSNLSSPKIEWPIGDGTQNILHNYGSPLGCAANANNVYFHNGVDFSASGIHANTARGGVVVAVGAGGNGGVRIDIDCGAAGTFRDALWHVQADVVVGINDVLAPGDDIGDLYDFTGKDDEANHTHFGTALAAGGGRISPLTLYTLNSDRDPNISSPVVADVNNDGKDFIIVNAANNDHTNPREPAYGDVDILVDAYDDMAAGFDLVVSPHTIGYWIQPTVPGAEAVQNSATPYLLIKYNYALRGAGAPCTAEAVATDAMYRDLPADLHGINTWQSYYTWVVTNTDGTDGDEANVDENQFWRTNARKGTGVEPNGSDASLARENQEAKFPDGTYYAHIVQEDHIHSSDHIRSVIVDNSRPYLKKVTVFSGPRIVYLSQWVWNSGTIQLESQPSVFDDALVSNALRTQDISIEVEFSEPMQTASISSILPLGITPTLSSTEPQHAKINWKAFISNLDIADNGDDDGIHNITFDGTDLAGNQLLQINDRADMPQNHHHRNAAGNMQGTAGTDDIHGFQIDPLEGIIPVTAIFMKQGPDDPITPTIADKSLQIEQALNDYFDEVSYNEISFVVNGQGWFQLDNILDWYYTMPQTPLIDLVQEAVTDAELNGVDITGSEYIFVITDENAARDEWSTNGAWPFNIATDPGWQLLASGVLNLNSSNARVTNLTGRMVGLIDLFAYPEVTVSRPFVGPWSHMSDKDRQVHVIGWGKWRAGWIDETGTATGKTLTRVPKPDAATPIVDQTYNILPLDGDDDGVKMVAIEIGDRLHYTAEYRLEQNLDTDIPDGEEGVLIVKTNEYINQGEGPAIVIESPVSSGDISDATFNLTSPRDEFNDVGSGVNIQVTSMDVNQAQIQLNYQIPPTENDVYVTSHGERYDPADIWIDAPDLEGNYEADPLTVRDAGEKPVIDHLNKVIGRVRNQGHADATNFEVHLEIREPWGAGGPWRSLKVETVPVLNGQDNNPNNYKLIVADWTPSGDIHSCVKLSIEGIVNDINTDNNRTQKNISQFVSTPGSLYSPVTTRFEIENPYDETILVFFKLDGLPLAWSYILSPDRLVIPSKSVGQAQITVQPNEEAPLCSEELITISAYTPRVDALKRLGAITMQTALKNAININIESWVQCDEGEYNNEKTEKDTGYYKQQSLQSRNNYYKDPRPRTCTIYNQGCTDPNLPNTQIAIVYTASDGSKQVHYVNTDENGCFFDMLTAYESGLWETQAVIEETDCRAETRSPKDEVNVEYIVGFDKKWHYFAYFGPNFPIGDFDDVYDPGFSFAMGIEKALQTQWLMNIQLGHHQFYSPNRNQHFTQLGLNVKYIYPSYSNRFLFLQAGGGYYIPRYGSNTLGLNVGAGIAWIIQPKMIIDLRLDYHYVNHSADGYKNAMFLTVPAGIKWIF